MCGKLTGVFPRTRRLRLIVGAAAIVVAVALVALLAFGDGDDGAPPRPSTPAATTPAVTTPTTPAATTPVPNADVEFPTDCAPVDGSRPLGLGIPRPTRLASSPIEQAVFANAFACLQAITGQTPVLRTQLPIDVVRRQGAPAGDEFQELTAFAYLLTTTGARGVVSVRSHDFTRCPTRGEGRPAAAARLEVGQPLASCEYPSVTLYEQLFNELHDELVRLAPAAEISYSAWNEPDHPMFTLQPGYGQRVAARRAGKYWSVITGIVGAERSLAGEFSDQDLPTLLALRDAFVEGAGGLTPAVWALHAYRDLTAPVAEVERGFAAAVAPSPVWQTEVTPRLSGRRGLSGRPTAQRRRGAALRARLTESQAPLILYLLTPPPPPTSGGEDGWDSAIADRAGRARPFICGLADLAPERCTGNADAFGG